MTKQSIVAATGQAIEGQSRTTMDPEETLDASPSEATPLEEADPTPSETTTEDGTETPVETPTETSTETPAVAEPELFELPDGRKVDAGTLSREWKENFYPDYTRKSQALAAKDTTPEDKETDPLKDPNYIPTTYEELAAQIETRILAGMSERQAREAAERQAIENGAIAQLAEVKAVDSTVNEGMLFQHAVKYGFTDLRAAHANMRDMSAAVKQAQKVTKENVAGRADPVSAKPGATGVPLNPDNFASSVDYLRAIKSQGK